MTQHSTFLRHTPSKRSQQLQVQANMAPRVWPLLLAGYRPCSQTESRSMEDVSGSGQSYSLCEVIKALNDTASWD